MTAKPEYSLDQLAKDLTSQRDWHQAAYDEQSNHLNLGYVGGFELALSLLKIHTNGDYGQSLAEQEEAAKKAADDIASVNDQFESQLDQAMGFEVAE